MPYSSLLVLPPRRGGDAPGVDLVASQGDFWFLSTETSVRFVLFSDAARGRAEELSCAKLGLLGEAPIFRGLGALLSTGLTAGAVVSHKGVSSNQGVPSVTPV